MSRYMYVKLYDLGFNIEKMVIEENFNTGYLSDKLIKIGNEVKKTEGVIENIFNHIPEFDEKYDKLRPKGLIKSAFGVQLVRKELEEKGYIRTMKIVTNFIDDNGEIIKTGSENLSDDELRLRIGFLSLVLSYNNNVLLGFDEIPDFDDNFEITGNETEETKDNSKDIFNHTPEFDEKYAEHRPKGLVNSTSAIQGARKLLEEENNVKTMKIIAKYIDDDGKIVNSGSDILFDDAEVLIDFFQSLIIHNDAAISELQESITSINELIGEGNKL